MKQMTRILLINWHYFQHQIVELGTVNLLTGNNTAGKSTIIDALQVALLGEIRSVAFNRAANNKHSERTLKSYLLGAMGEDIENGQRSVREGKDFSSYLAVEFYDNEKASFFCVGAMFDVYANGGDIGKRFFWYQDKMNDMLFLNGQLTADLRTVSARITEYCGKSRCEFSDTAKSYQAILLRKFNVHEERFFSMMKKAISFEPISDIEAFITQNVCDIEESIDIRTMQENIQYYKAQEQMADKFEEKLRALKIINEKYAELAELFARRKRQKFLIAFGELESERANLRKTEKQQKTCQEALTQIAGKLSELAELKKKRELERDALRAERDKYWNDQNGEMLKQEIQRLDRELKDAGREIKQFVTQARTDALQWEKHCAELQTVLPDSHSLKKMLGILRRLTGFQSEHLSQFSVPYFSDLRGLYLSIRKDAEPIYNESSSRLLSTRQQISPMEEEIARLKKGIKSYPSKAEQLKKVIAEGLRRKHGKEIPVHFLADLIDITDESWHNAVEGYLNTQRMNLIVPPEYFMDAFQIYRSVHKKLNVHEYAVVDLEKVQAYHAQNVPHNLAEIVRGKDSAVQAYMNYLLGRVTRCEEDTHLRDARISVTRDCMLYQNFAVKPLNPAAYETPLIGRDAVQKQIVQKTMLLESLKTEIAELQKKHAAFQPYFQSEWFLTENYIASTVSHVFSLQNEQAEKQANLEKYRERFSQINAVWISEMDDKIQAISNQIADIETEREKRIGERRENEIRSEQLLQHKIPELKRLIAEKQEQMNLEYTADYQSETGIPRFQNELQKYGSPAAVADAFRSPLSQTCTLIEKTQKVLTNLRADYNRVQNESFDCANCESNEQYETAYKQIAEVQLPEYRERIEKAKQDAMEQFKSDFLYKLRDYINHATEKVGTLNDALRKVKFGTDRYHFEINPNPQYLEYYNMIMDNLLEMGGNSIFSYEFTEKYQSTIDSLFRLITIADGDDITALQNVQKFSEYQTYLSFDMLIIKDTGQRLRLSKSLKTNSGGETQNPFYIAMLASFAQLYRVHDMTDYGNTIRIVIFDEAFNKMDSIRIAESIRLLREFDLQAIICAPPGSIADIAPLAEKTLLVHKEQIGNQYSSMILPYTKEMIEDEIFSEQNSESPVG